MVRQNAVFIVGAGAGADIRMPLGPQLARQISERVTNKVENRQLHFGNEWLPIAFRHEATGNDVNPADYERACIILANGLPLSPSIDEFLYAHSEDKAVQLLGKVAIAQCILDAERRCLLFFEENRHGAKMKLPADSWLVPFFSLMQRRIRKGEELKIFEGLSVINFNYDRCIEHFLFHAIRNYFGATPQRAAEVMLSLNILHPYGSVGPLPWEGKPSPINFGQITEAPTCAQASRDLRTFNEEVDDKAKLQKLHHLIESAETLIFLGSHLHLQNIELLGPSKNTARIYATVLGRSAEDNMIVERRLKRFLSNPMDQRRLVLTDCDCVSAFKQFGLTWANIVTEQAKPQ